MPISFNTMLVEAGLSPRDVCLLRHKDTQARRVVRHTNCGAISWSGPGTSRILGISTATNRLRRQNETLFVGLYGVKYRGLIECDTPMLTRDDIDKAGSCDVYDLTVQEPLRDLIGRLVIDWVLPLLHGFNTPTGRISRSRNCARSSRSPISLAFCNSLSHFQLWTDFQSIGRQLFNPPGVSTCSPVPEPRSNMLARQQARRASGGGGRSTSQMATAVT